jgi:hypothetical protein
VAGVHMSGHIGAQQVTVRHDRIEQGEDRPDGGGVRMVPQGRSPRPRPIPIHGYGPDGVPG